MNMKIGIMTMQRIINYGSFLQAYGLKKTIESFGGYEVQFVDYEVGKPIDTLINKPLKSSNRIYNGLRVMFSSKYRKKRRMDIKQNDAFAKYYNKFKEEWLPMLGVTSSMNYKPELDTLVIGSDEVFNCTQSGKEVGYSLQLFGKDHNAKNLISYAASFGSTTLSKLNSCKKTDEIRDCLKRFDAISTRDNNSYKIVKELTGKDPVDNMDPVLVYSFDNEVPNKVDLKNYIVVYAYSGRISIQEAEAIQKFAHKHSKKTVSIGVMQAFTDEYVMADPFELLAYIKNADFVVTDTFHGTVFSIKYQIPFATIIRDSNKQKLTDLLYKFNLQNRAVDSVENLESVLLESIDANSIKRLITEYRCDSLKYLKCNLAYKCKTSNYIVD